MDITNDETTTDEATSVDAADEGASDEAASPSPQQEEPSAAASTSEAGDEVDDFDEEGNPLTPEQKKERAAAKEKDARAQARIKAAEAAEKKAEEQRALRRRQLDEQEREARIAAREREAQAAIQQAQAMFTELNGIKSKLLKGGPEALKALGVEYGDLTREYILDNSPEAVAQRALDEATALREELRKRDEDAQRQAAAMRRRAAAEEGQRVFHEAIDSRADEYPHAFALPTRFRQSIADEIAFDFRQRNGDWPPLAYTLARLDERAKELQDETSTRTAKRAQPGTQPSDGATNTQATNGNGHHASTPPNRTLTAATAAQKATAKRPMTDEEIDEWSRQELRKALAQDRKSSGA